MIVGEALAQIDNYYVDSVEKDALLTAAMDGMTSILDEHSEYIPGDDYQSFQDSIQQEFAGIGIFVEQPESGKPVRVVTPLVGSPALNAGVLPGDEIVKVDGEDVSEMILNDVSSRLRGPVATSVALVVRRSELDDKGNVVSFDDVPLSVTRAVIPLPSVIGDYRDPDDRWVYRLRDESSIAYIRITSFGDKTVNELQTVLRELDNSFDGLVIDLRGNGGGLLTAAVDVSDMFLNHGQIVSTRVRGGKKENEFSASPGTLVDESKPIAVLIDGASASASEIVAASLQDNQRAAIVGTRSYGKGTVQNILPLQYGLSALRLTVARYYRPNGENIHRKKDAGEDEEWGVKPDPGMEVKIEEEALQALAKRWREASYPAMASQNEAALETDRPSGLSLDAQLRRAVEQIQGKEAENPSESEPEIDPTPKAA